jgi:hypothetical protein
LSDDFSTVVSFYADERDAEPELVTVTVSGQRSVMAGLMALRMLAKTESLEILRVRLMKVREEKEDSPLTDEEITAFLEGLEW